MSETPFQKVTVYMPPDVCTNLDRAILEARATHGNHVSRSDVVVAIIESVDIPRFVAKLAKDSK